MPIPGLDALVDEATGYQYDRAEDALQIKLRAYLEDEMRKWERTFPDELWKEFDSDVLVCAGNQKGDLYDECD